VKPVCERVGQTVCNSKFLIEEDDMNIATMLLDGPLEPGVAVFFFLAIGSIALFSFLSIATWAGTRQNEREAYYKAEMLKKIAEIGGERNPALEYLREKERISAAKRVGGFRLGGLINIAIGLALLMLLHALVPVPGVFLVGLIPLFVGVALVAYGYWLAPTEV
jgi:hypothetical protein